MNTLSDSATPYSKCATPYTIGYEGNESHVIKNMAATATVRSRAARHRKFVPCDQLFSSISFIVR